MSLTLDIFKREHMDCTTLALNLIKAYNAEYNRYRRAEYKKLKILRNEDYVSDMKANGFAITLQRDCGFRRGHDIGHARSFFRNADGTGDRIVYAFVSAAVKRNFIKKAEKELDNIRDYASLEVRNHRGAEIQTLKQKPVLSKLGKQWQTYVDALLEEQRAYHSRWEARCAIKAFNKMNTGVLIKFGNCNRGNGSMGYIHHVVIDGDKIPLRKFLDNVEFESAILAA